MKNAFWTFLGYIFSLIFALPLTILALLIISLVALFFGGLPFELLFILFVIFYVASVVLFIITFNRNLWRKWSFWILSVVSPLIIMIIFDIIFPYTQNQTSKKYEKLFYANVGITSYNDLYRVRENENSAKFVPILNKLSDDKKDSLVPFLSFVYEIDKYSDSIIKNRDKILKTINPFISLMDSFYEYDDYQYVYPADYEDSILSIPIAPLINIKIFTNANLLYAFINLNINDSKSIERFEKVLKFSNLISYDPILINGLMSLLIKDNIVDFIIYALKNDKIKNYKLLSDFVNKIYNECENKSTIIPTNTIIKEGKIRWISPIYFETFSITKFINGVLVSFMMKPLLRYYFEFNNLKSLQQMSLIVSFLPFYNSIYYVNKPELYKKQLEIFPQKFNDWKEFKKYFIKENFPEKFEKIYSNKKYSNSPYFITAAFILNPTRILSKELVLKTKISLIKAYLDMKNEKKDWNKEDPFSLDKFIYKKEGNISKLYSVGENLKDDSGKEDDILIEWNNANKKLINLYIKPE